MAKTQTTILEEYTEHFNGDTGEVYSSSKKSFSKSKLEVTDEFIKVSKYLNLIFAYNDIPLSMVPISLLLAQRMEFKTNVLYLLKSDKEELAQMLGVTFNRVNDKIQECKKYDIIRPTGTRGKYVVNCFLFSTGNLVETRDLQAQFDISSNTYAVRAEQHNLITQESVRKTVTNKKMQHRLEQTPGQLSLFKED